MAKKKKTEIKRFNPSKSMLEKEARYKKAMSGDADALVMCMFDQGMCTMAEMEDYFKIKKEYGDHDDEEEIN